MSPETGLCRSSLRLLIFILVICILLSMINFQITPSKLNLGFNSFRETVREDNTDRIKYAGEYFLQPLSKLPCYPENPSPQPQLTTHLPTSDCINNRTSTSCEIKDLLILDEMGSRDAKLQFAAPIKYHLQPEMGKLVYQNFVLTKSKSEVNFSMLIVVLSTTEAISREMRDAIRTTWGNPSTLKKHSSRVVFLIGISQSQKNFKEKLNNLVEENYLFGDLIAIDFRDSYYRLPVKVLRMLEWFNGVYRRSYMDSYMPTFLMKIDEDVLLNLPKLFGKLYSEESLVVLKSQGFLVAGTPNINSTVVPNPQSKFHISKEFWLGERTTYPDYLNGPCYVLSGNLAEKIFKAALETPMFPFEDIYITGFVMGERLNLLKNVQRLTWYHLAILDKSALVPDILQKVRDVICTHGVKKGELMRFLYGKLQ